MFLYSLLPFYLVNFSWSPLSNPQRPGARISLELKVSLLNAQIYGTTINQFGKLTIRFPANKDEKPSFSQHSSVSLTKFAMTIVSNIAGSLGVPRVNCSPLGGCLVWKSEQCPIDEKGNINKGESRKKAKVPRFIFDENSYFG